MKITIASIADSETETARRALPALLNDPG